MVQGCDGNAPIISRAAGQLSVRVIPCGCLPNYREGPIQVQLEHFYDSEGQEIDRARHVPASRLYIPFDRPVGKYSQSFID